MKTQAEFQNHAIQMHFAKCSCLHHPLTMAAFHFEKVRDYDKSEDSISSLGLLE